MQFLNGNISEVSIFGYFLKVIVMVRARLIAAGASLSYANNESRYAQI